MRSSWARRCTPLIPVQFKISLVNTGRAKRANKDVSEPLGHTARLLCEQIQDTWSSTGLSMASGWRWRSGTSRGPALTRPLSAVCLSVRSCLSYKRHPGRFWLPRGLAPSHSSCLCTGLNIVFSSVGPAAPSPGSLGRRGHMAGPMPRSLYLGA